MIKLKFVELKPGEELDLGENAGDTLWGVRAWEFQDGRVAVLLEGLDKSGFLSGFMAGMEGIVSGSDTDDA